MTHGQGEHAGAAIDAKMCIPQQFGLRSPGALAPGDLPGFALAPGVVEQLVAFLPAHHKAHAEAGEPREPGTGAVPAIEDMAHLASPLSCGPGQQLLLLFALLSLDSFLSSPPGHGYHLRPALFAYHQHARAQRRPDLHRPGHHRRHISHHPSIQIGIQPLAIGRQIVFEFTCPRLTLFLRGLFLDSWYVILREHEEDLLWLTEAFVCLPQCTSGGRLLSASWLFRPFVPKVCSGSCQAIRLETAYGMTISCNVTGLCRS